MSREVSEIDDTKRPDSRQYFGSVRFFKHVILCVIIFSYCAFSYVTISLYRGNAQLMKDISGLRNEMAELKRQIEEADIRNGANLQSNAKPLPDMYGGAASKNLPAGDGTIYLTIDDGPSPLTGQILDILAKHGVAATFFVTGKEHSRDAKSFNVCLKEIVDHGHGLAPHSYTHRYSEIYSSPQAWLSDFKRIADAIYEATGQRSSILRFPGGSNIAGGRILSEVKSRGYTWYDWNITAADTAPNATARSVSENIVNAVDKRTAPKIILMHDGNRFSLAALENVIIELKRKGYSFGKLTDTVPQIAFAHIK